MEASRTWRGWRTAGLLALCLFAASMAASSFLGAATAADPKIEAELLDQVSGGQEATFWVYLSEKADLTAAAGIRDWGAQGRFVYDRLTETAARSQADLLALLDAEGVEYQSFWIANTVRVTGGEELLDEIAARPEVERITADRVYELPEPIPAEEENRIQAVEWGIDRINAPDVWDEFGVRGAGIVVGSIDTGVLFSHAALVEQYRGNQGDGSFDHNYNWHDPSSVCGSPSLVPCDNNGHGTHVTGTMVGDDGGDNQIGVAPEAKWIAAKGCETTSCSQSALLSSGQFILAPTRLDGSDPDPDRRPHIVNNSWGGGATTDPWYRPTVEAWVAAGIFPQFANGNNIPGCTAASNPGNLLESYSTGAFDINNNIAGFSNRGPSAWDAELIKPNIAAPGVAVRSAWNNGAYNTISGTSMASPHVAGTIALMWSAAVALERDIDGTRDLLDLTAIDTSDLSCGGTPENNNVYGEGRLDAFAAVDESPRGPTGMLEGTVTDADTADPIAGATITITGEVDRVRSTDADGTYTITLPVGDYDVTASAFGYASQTAQVTIDEDETTTQDFALEAVDNITLSGTITDGSGHGWPLYAKVSATGTPRSTYTNPLTGEYSLELPAQASYNILVQSQYPGYQDKTETVEADDEDITLDVELIADQCAVAPGYEFGASVGVAGDFNGLIAAFLNSRGIPSSVYNWGDDPSEYDLIIVNRPGNPGQGTFLDFLAATDAAGTGVVFLDTWSTLGNGVWLLWQHVGIPSSRQVGFSAANPYIYYEVLEEHPILNGFEVGDEVILSTVGDKDHAWFGGYEGEGRAVIADAYRADLGRRGEGIGVQERANNRHVLLSMHGVSSFIEPSHWTADGAQVFLNALEWAAAGASFECILVEGGLVLGHVTDMNTGAGINGATVSSDANPDDSGMSFATPDDPALDDGFYWLFSSLTGNQQFTASMGNYTPATQTVNVVADAANEANFVLAAGLLTVSPTSVSATLRLGQSANRTFTITNNGTAPAQVELSERRGSFEIRDGGGGEPAAGIGGEVRYVEGTFSPAARPAETRSGEAPAEQAGPADAPAAPPWENIASYPVAIMDNSATQVDDKVYSFGGFSAGAATANAYVFDPATEGWSPIANLPGPRQKPEVVDIDGLIYIVGGWDGTGGTAATTLIYNPASDSYSQGANMPAGRTAPGAAVLDGQLYVVGGCTTTACPTSNSVWRYDPGADSWETLANYPQSVAWLGCAGVDGRVYCAGGTDGTSAFTSTYAYDPGGNSWTEKASMPYDNWAMGYAAANDQFVVSAGVTAGFSLVTNRSAAYAPGSDSWTEIEPANHTVYRLGSTCGFYKLGGSTGGFTPSVGSEFHPEYGECEVDVDVPWLSVSPLTATLQPGQSVTVTVSMDGNVEQPGTYTAGVGIKHDTPYTVNPVGVTMIVTPPNNWGKITGTVLGRDCQGNESPLAGATVQIDGRREQVTLSTDGNGVYARWMATNNNPLRLVVSHTGHVPQTRTTQLVPRQTAVANFVLQRIC